MTCLLWCSTCGQDRVKQPHEPTCPEISNSPRRGQPPAVLPYRGLGSGIKRALDDWPKIEFVDDREANLFTSTVHRKELSDTETEGVGEKTLGKTPRKTPDKILMLLREDPRLAIPDLAASIGKSESAVERAIRRLREQNRLRRVGPDKGGHWEVIE